MTQKQKFWHKIGIVFLALSLLCAVMYLWLSSQNSWEQIIEHAADTDAEAAKPIVDLVSGLAMNFTEWLGAMSGLLLSLLGAILALGTVLFCMGKPWKIAGGAGIALHVGLLIAFFVRYGEILKSVFILYS